MVKIRLPPPLRPVSPIITTIAVNTKLIRIYDPTRYNATALSFRYFGPISRFDHHLTDDDNKPVLNNDRCIIYAAFTLSSCLVEIFGDGDIIEVNTQEVATIYTSSQLQLLDLRENGAMKAGTVAAISKTASRTISQAWSQYFYERVDLYEVLDGIIYSNAHNDEDAIALYERAIPKLSCSQTGIMPLSHRALRGAIFQIASRHSLLVKPY